MPVAVAVVLTLFVFDLNCAATKSMSPTINVGNCIYVSHLAYGPGERPERGDVVTFLHDGSVYVKRIVGLPGDVCQMTDGEIYLNGEKQSRTRIEDVEFDRSPAPQYAETLTGGRSFRTLDLAAGSFMDNTPEYRVPENSYFVPGDNRDNSTYSRSRSFGFVPEDALIGRALFAYGNNRSRTFAFRWLD